MNGLVTYRATLREGKMKVRIEVARQAVLQVGEMRFGLPDEATRRAITAMRSLKRLEPLAEAAGSGDLDGIGQIDG